MDEQLEIVAARNGGYFTRAEALDCGYQDRDLFNAVRDGVIRKLRQGAYAPALIYDALDDIGRHLVLARATLARQRGPVALAGVSAAAFHGLDLFGHDLGFVDLVRLDGGASRREVNARHHVTAHEIASSIEEWDGILVTDLSRTVWDVAAHAALEGGVVAADSALKRVPELRASLDELVDRMGNRPGARRARIAIGVADGRSGSPGESISRVQFYRYRLPMPELQHRVHDESGEFVADVDFYWEGDRHVGEFDGKVKYGRLRRPGESEGDAVFREKRREDRVRGESLGMSRWCWVDIFPPRVAAWINRLNADRERSRRIYARNRTIIA